MKSSHKYFAVLGILILVFLGSVLVLKRDEPKETVISIGNPAAVYCTEVMGYDYRIENDAEGGQRGFCVLPDNQECEQWDFYAGSCGADYSYCAREGYDLETRRDGQDPFSPSYALCLEKDGQLAGTASQLSALSEIASKLNDSIEIPAEPTEPENITSLSETVAAPPSWDWRNYNSENWLTPVRNQSSCGSCWAFAAIGITEAHHNIITANPDLDLNLSEQELVSCSPAGDCGGGSSTSALSYIRDTGVSDEACMPYSATNATCSKCTDWASRLTSIDSYHSIWYPPSATASATIKDKLTNYGPVVVYMGIGSDFGGYFDANDVYRCTDDSSINHGVVIVGYNDVGNYWIVRNSWGSSWGPDNDGYFKIGYGECSIERVLIAYAESYSPSTPQNFHVTGSAQYSISLGWDDLYNETGYKIYRKDGASFIYLDSVDANITTYTDTDVNCNESYEYKLSGYNASGESAQTDAVIASTSSTCPPRPDNDDFDYAINVALYTTELKDTREATQDPDDPDLSACGITGTGQATVWYSYEQNTGVDSAISLDTKTADYDTFIAVWTGTRTDLTLVACNDDLSDSIKQSEVAFRVTSGETYYIEIGQP